MIPQTYTFWHDPGHAWLEVPVGDLKELGLTHSISRYSYRKGDQTFLEEDCDASVFINAFEARYGHAPSFHEHYDAEDYVRSLSHF